MITGANSGIGKSTALALARKGATVHMVCRNPSRGENAKEDIVSQTGNNVSCCCESYCSIIFFIIN